MLRGYTYLHKKITINVFPVIPRLSLTGLSIVTVGFP